MCACVNMNMVGLGVCSPRKICKLDTLRLLLRPLLAVIIVICTSSHVWLQFVKTSTCHAVAVAEQSKFLSFQCWVFIGLLSLRRGHNIVRLDTSAPGSLQHAARLETSWSGQWLCYLAAVVSICEYTVSNKGGLPCHSHDCGQLCPHTLYFVGAVPPLLPLLRRVWYISGRRNGRPSVLKYGYCSFANTTATFCQILCLDSNELWTLHKNNL